MPKPSDPERPAAVAPHAKTPSPAPDTSTTADDNMSVAGEEDPGASLDTSGLPLAPTLPPEQQGEPVARARHGSKGRGDRG